MILALEVPYLETAVRGGTVSEWLKQPGDQIAFGEAICTIAIDEWLALRRDKRATTLSRLMSASRVQRENRYEWRQQKGLMTVEIVVSETAYLRRILADSGTRVRVGETLALLATTVDESIEDQNPRAPAMRVAARPREET